MGPYLVLLALAALGLALGWRLTPAPIERSDTSGLTRLVQLGVAATGLMSLALLMLPFVMNLGAIGCTTQAERAGECIIGVHERGLFAAAVFSCLIGVASAFVLRKGLLDFSDTPAVAEPSPALGQAVAVPVPERERAPVPDAEPERAPEPEPEPDEPSSHRRLEGPAFRAFVDDAITDLDVAIETAAKRLRSDRVAVVFSRGASKDANEALLELAEAFDAYRYVLEGTAAATEGLPIGAAPKPHEADEIAGPDAHHAGELALDLAGGLIETVFLLDTRVAFPEYVLGRLTVLQSVCIAHAHDEVSAACQVLLPGTNPGEAEGELIADGGGINQRCSRATLVKRLVAALKQTSASSTAIGLEPEPEQPRDHP